MRGRSLWIVALLMPAAALAGCLGNGAPAAANGGPGDVAPDAESGVVRGIVTTDEQSPLAGALVALVDVGLENVTDRSGRFVLSGVPAGTHTLAVQKLGYESAAQKVEVDAGQTTDLSVQLAAIQVVEPFQETLIFDGYIACAMGLIVVTIVTGCGTTDSGTALGNITVDPNEKNIFHQPGRPGLLTVVGEMVWTQAAVFAATELNLDLYRGWYCDPFCSVDEDYGNAEGPSPVVLVSEDFDDIEDKTVNIQHVASVDSSSDDPPFVIIVLQQDFTLYSTHFFGEPAPEGFAARPDA